LAGKARTLSAPTVSGTGLVAIWIRNLLESKPGDMGSQEDF
jgi:hypothetical protein